MRFLLGVLMLMISGSALATIDVLQFKDEAQEQQFRQLTEELRCPKCQNNSIADSNSMIATDLRQKVYELMQEVKAHLDSRGEEYMDFGCHSTEAVDYPIYARKVAKAILEGECERGILICGTGIGISIAANKIPGIRAALCTDCFSAQATREHNDANILALGGRVVGAGLALKIVDTFLDTPFSDEERHKRRIALIEAED